jgi:hypothetical protein
MTPHPGPVVEPGVAAVRLVIDGVDTHDSTHHAAVLISNLAFALLTLTVVDYLLEHGRAARLWVPGTASRSLISWFAAG